MSQYPDTTTEPTAHTRQSAAGDRSELTDAQLAYKMVMADRNSLDLTAVQYEARNRILKLSAQLWDLRKALEAEIDSHGGTAMAFEQFRHNSIAKPLVTKHRPDPELDHTLSVVSDALNQETSSEP